MELYFADAEICFDMDHAGQGDCFIEFGRNIAESFDGVVPESWQADMCSSAPVEHRSGCVDSLIRYVLQDYQDYRALDAASEICNGVAAYLGSEPGVDAVHDAC